MLSLGRYSTWDQFLGFNKYFGFLIDVSGYSRSLIDVNGYFKFLADIYGYFKSLVDIIGYLILVEFSGIIRSVESNRFLRYRVDISRNLRLIDLNGFFKF